MYDIGLPELKIIKRSINEDNDCIYTAEPKNAPTMCIKCGSEHFIKYRRYNRKIRDLNERNHRVGIVIKGHRYQCKDCGATFSEQYDCITSEQLTKRLKDKILSECFNRTFKEIAEEYGISRPSVKRVFDEYIGEINASYKPYAPQVLGIDEVHLHKQYCGVFVDVTGQRVIEMTENRNKETVKSFLKSLPDKEKITCVTMDMWKIYKFAVKEVLPNAVIVIDKFHVIKELNKALEDLRRRLRKDMSKEARISLKNMRFLFLTGVENLTQRQKDQLQEIFDEYPQFEMPYNLKEMLRDIFTYAKTKEEAERAYAYWVKLCEKNFCTEYFQFIRTVKYWHKEIFNYFDYRYTNAQTESLNNVIREIDRAGRGYTFDVLRAKMLFRGAVAKKGKFNYKDD